MVFQEEDKENKPVKPPLKRQTTGYNLFCSKVMSSGKKLHCVAPIILHRIFPCSFTSSSNHDPSPVL